MKLSELAVRFLACLAIVFVPLWWWNSSTLAETEEALAELWAQHRVCESALGDLRNAVVDRGLGRYQYSVSTGRYNGSEVITLQLPDDPEIVVLNPRTCEFGRFTSDSR